MGNLTEQAWFQKIMKSEGGLNLKEPASVGGKSYAGVSQKTYEAWLAQKCQIADAPSDIEGLAAGVVGTEHALNSPFETPPSLEVRVDVIEAFYEDYFVQARVELLPPCLQYIHADFFVNAGFAANKILQRIVRFSGDDVDGILGPASRARLLELMSILPPADLIMEYHAEKLEHYRAIKKTNPSLYDANIRGWTQRAQHILSELEEYFLDAEPTVSAIDDEVAPVSLFEVPEPPEKPPLAPQTLALHEVPTDELLSELTRRMTAKE